MLERVSLRRGLAAELGLLLGLCLVLGTLAGLAWWRLTVLPGYLVTENSAAVTTERGLTEQFSSDAWFSALGAGAGLLIGGYACWRFLRRGPVVVLLAGLGSLLAAGVCWLAGSLLAPVDFNARIAAAAPGDIVPSGLVLSTWVSAVVWPFAAVLPILLWSSLAPDAEQPRPLRGHRPRRGVRGRHEAVAGVVPQEGVEEPGAPAPRRGIEE